MRYFKVFFLSFIFIFLVSFGVHAEPVEKWWSTYPNRSGEIISYNEYPSGNHFWQYNLSSKNSQFIFHLAGSSYLYMFTDKVNSDLDFLYTEMAFSDSGEITTAARNAASLDTSGIGNLSASVRSSLVNCSVYRCSVLRSGATNLVFDFEGSWAELNSYLENGGDYKPPIDPDNTLPLLTYTCKKHVYMTASVPVMRWNTYINWDYKEKEPYSSSPNSYLYEIRFCKAIIDNGGDILDSAHASPDWSETYLLDSGALPKNESSFSNFELNKKLVQLGITQQNCYILIRTKEVTGSKFSNWTTFYVAGLNASPTYYGGGSYDDKGNPTDDLSPEQPGWHFDPTEGKDSSDTETSAGNNKDSEIYNTGSNKLDTKDAISSLKTAVESLESIIPLFSLVYSWLPSWLTSMIAVSIALLVIVGLIKLIIS